MSAKTLYFGNPAKLHLRLSQLVIHQPNAETPHTTPLEEVGIVILDNPQITITQALVTEMLSQNIALICCNSQHLPTGLMLNLHGNTLQSAHFREQIAATEPLKKQLWQQTVQAKIRNQATLLEMLQRPAQPLWRWAEDIKAGDPDNKEARAAAYYWKHLFEEDADFRRSPDGLPPNNLLNYAYAIVRAMVARSLVASGLLPTLGIFHRNQYNAYCLADDIMEPYRPFADALVLGLLRRNPELADSLDGLTPAIKREVLGIVTQDVWHAKQRHTMSAAIERSTASLAKCFARKSKTIFYPHFEGYLKK
ncbi:CRISP-associated protein Cas1 [Flexibacter flexilis DSM 6793]|uniref:CRISPR-associated endonuclease Cas1 n=1 Tax=Flexibacter flexilis DSM 6793 TaxID=927664 RepID=A0A1I1LCJ5_9BACT|nr:type II CRISPR-associated endonuclease Cas1 [Flexibacter flexilis]SFC70741.1 CRISP-associated protein Cas1 [Flexibacter flexilis DSM 6793]